MRDMHEHHHGELFRSLTASLAVGVPSLCLAAWLIEARPALSSPSSVMLMILALSAVNVMLVLAIEEYQARLSALTFPALLATSGVSLLFVIAEGVNRFAFDAGYVWLFPFVAGGLVVSALAMFRESGVLLKCLLGLNVVALAALWCMGAVGKIVLPF